MASDIQILALLFISWAALFIFGWEMRDWWQQIKYGLAANSGETKIEQILKSATLKDCLQLWRKGYRVEVNDGRVTAVVKESKKNNGIKPQ